MTDERPTVMRYLEHAASQRPGRIAAVQDGGGVYIMITKLHGIREARIE